MSASRTLNAVLLILGERVDGCVWQTRAAHPPAQISSLQVPALRASMACNAHCIHVQPTARQEQTSLARMNALTLWRELSKVFKIGLYGVPGCQATCKKV